MVIFRRYPIILPLIVTFIFVIGCIGNFLLKPPSRGSIWLGYKILAVSSDISEKTILDLIKTTNAKKVVSQSTSQLSSVSEYAPYQPELEKINAERNKWFINRDQNFRFFFIKEYHNLAGELKNALHDIQGSYLLEETESVNKIPAIISILYFFIVLILFKARKSFFWLTIPILLFTAISQTPMDVIPVGVFIHTMLLLFKGYKINTLDPKKNFKMIVSSKYSLCNFIPLLIVLPLLFLPQSRGLFVFFLNIILVSIFWFAITYWSLFFKGMQDNKRLHQVFTPIPIRVTRHFLFWKTDIIKKHLVVFLILCCTVIIFSFIQTSSSSDKTTLRELSIPVPTGYTSPERGFSVDSFSGYIKNRSLDQLPDLADFVIAIWNSKSFPWIKEGFPKEDPLAHDLITYVEYSEIANKLIPATNEIISFDSRFILEALSKHATPLEQMLMQQNRFVEVKMSRNK